MRTVQAGSVGFSSQGPRGKITQVMKVTPPSQGTWVPDPWKAEGLNTGSALPPEVTDENTAGVCPCPALLLPHLVSSVPSTAREL